MRSPGTLSFVRRHFSLGIGNDACNAITYFLHQGLIYSRTFCEPLWYENMVSVTVDPSKCNGDSVCVDLCPVAAFELKEVPGFEGKKSVVVNNDACVACRACEAQCSTQAITITD